MRRRIHACIPHDHSAHKKRKQQHTRRREVLFRRQKVSLVYQHPQEEGLVEALKEIRA